MMKILFLLIFAISEFVIAMGSVYLIGNIKGIILMPAILLALGIILKQINKQPEHDRAIWYLLWSSTIAVAVMIPLELAITTIQC